MEGYPLVNIQKNYGTSSGTSPFYKGKSTIRWPCSMAFCMFTRGVPISGLPMRIPCPDHHKIQCSSAGFTGWSNINRGERWFRSNINSNIWVIQFTGRWSNMQNFGFDINTMALSQDGYMANLFFFHQITLLRVIPTMTSIRLLAFYLTYLLAFYLAYLLAFYLAYLLAFYLAYLLQYVLAYLLAYLLTFFLTLYLA